MARAWRQLTWFSGVDPTTEELLMLRESRERVRLVIRARWPVLGLLAAYGLYVYVLFRHESADTAVITPTHRAADGAMYAAERSGKNRVVLAGDPLPLFPPMTREETRG